MKNNEIEEFLAAYRQGATADFLQPKIDGKYGTLWTIPPCDPAATERAGKQMVRMGATELLWVRRAQLRTDNDIIDVAIFSEMPNRSQTVVSLVRGEILVVCNLLADKSTESYLSTFSASTT